VIDYYRSTRNRPIGDSEEVLLAIADRSQDQHEDVLISEQKQHLLRQLQKLSELDQEVLRLRFFVGLSSEQIAEIIGKTPVATRKLQSRAVAKLRRLIEDEEKL
jgi:RNA polymerase sigma-70 factor (ECF subfamily)